MDHPSRQLPSEEHAMTHVLKPVSTREGPRVFSLLLVFMGVLVLAMLAGIPIPFSMGICAVAALLLEDGPGFYRTLVAQRQLYGVFDNFTVLAIPFFLLTGRLMNAGGMTRRVFRFAKALVGYLPGGLGHVNVVASTLFAGMSGSAVADVAGLGPIEIQAMVEDGYDLRFSAAVTGASSVIGPVIPPSIPMVLYGVTGGVSIGSLFLGGFIPGCVLAGSLMATVAIISLRRHYPRAVGLSLREVLASFADGAPSLLTAAILLVGIYSGAFTPTEAAAVAAIYAFALTLAYRELDHGELMRILREAAQDTAVIMFIIANSALYGYLVVRSGLPAKVATLLQSVTSSPTVLMLMIVGVLAVVGCFMDVLAAILVFTPIFMPVINAAGIDPVHFGIVMILTLMLGLVTPPVGAVLFTLCKVAKMPFDEVVASIVPFYIPILVTVLTVALVPGIALYLPRLFGM